MVAEYFGNFGLQLLFTVGVIAIFGLGIGLLQRAFYKLLGRYAYKVCLVTGALGTPVHEVGHAIFCLIFGHKITEMRLYQADDETGTLGYVNHTYNPRNVYHQIGNFFIGIGPIIFGSGVLILLMFLLAPQTFYDLTAAVSVLSGGAQSFSGVTGVIGKAFEAMFAGANLINPLWWLNLVLSVLIALHMSLSLPDIKSSALGFCYILAVLLIVDLILALVGHGVLSVVTSAAISAGIFLIQFLSLSILFSTLLVAVTGLVRLITLLVRAVKRK